MSCALYIGCVTLLQNHLPGCILQRLLQPRRLRMAVLKVCDDRRSLQDERAGDRGTQPPAGSGHECDFSGEVLRHRENVGGLNRCGPQICFHVSAGHSLSSHE